MNKERKTEQKEILLKYLQKHKNKHLNIQDIYIDLKEEIGMTTIYRIINSLIEKGCVNKIPLENKQGYCYTYNPTMETCNSHYHLICEKCNHLFHFESKELPKVSKEAKQNEEFEIDNSRIVFYGLCKKCKSKRREF